MRIDGWNALPTEPDALLNELQRTLWRIKPFTKFIQSYDNNKNILKAHSMSHGHQTEVEEVVFRKVVPSSPPMPAC